MLLTFELVRSGAGSDRDSLRKPQNYNSESAITVGGERPASLILPANYKKETPVALLINLHGYTGDSISQSTYTFLQSAAEIRGVAYIAPDGLQDSTGNRFWNASSACCNFKGSKVSDVDYISGLIKEISKKVSIDSSRIYLFGHSNGHFMSYAIACSTDGLVTAIAGLAGAMEADPSSCKRKPMNVLHIHGTSDGTISFNGGSILGNPYPSVQETLAQWASINSCTNPREKEIDLLQSMAGSETSETRYTCSKGDLELWRINGGVHVPVLDQEFALRTLDWLLTHRK